MKFTFFVESATPTSGGADGEMIDNSTAKLGLVCHNEYIEVTLESKNYPGLDTNVTHLQDEACVPGYRDATKVIFRFGLGDCQTEYEEDESEIRYMNKIIAVVNDENEEGAITRSSTRVLPFQCSYKKKAVISKVQVNPQFTKIITNTEDFGNFSYEVNLYTDKDYSNKVDEFPYVIGISQRMYLEMRVESGDSGLILFPDECKATPSQDINDKPDHAIIENACPRDKTLEFEYKMSGEQRFSLVAFRFKSGYQDVYIHCKMTVCRSKEEESKCAKGCQENENDSRKKREVKDDFLIKQFIGPIKVKGEEDKDALGKKASQDNPQMFTLVGVLVGVLGVVMLGLIAALIIVIRKRRTEENAATLLVYDE
ncbi:unnamed protein product [Porites lobata]|uniref:ZP domain-containing protein n=1 Tax=Porites lobata TaxID=104759 RepID=A0ABN8NF21_9CNID|nr:unnamed protein product [Porites lobata]